MQSYKYKAFLSYSHAADAKLAPALQSALQQFAKPWYRLRAIRIFRDGTNLSATPNLWNEILAALADSEFYIIMASPAASQSRWVRQEIGYWLSSRDPAKMIFVLTDGIVKWNPSVDDFDWSETTALPDSVRGLLKQEPLYLDFTWTRSRDRLSSRDPEFQSRIASIAATLHGRPKDEIFGEDLRQHRKAMQIAWASIALLTLLAVAATSLGIMAYLNGIRLQQSLSEIQVKQRHTRAGYLAGRSQFWLNEYPQLATLLAIESVNATKQFGQPVNPASEQALRNALASLGGQPATGHSRPVGATAILNDGRLATASSDWTVMLQDLQKLGTSVTRLSGLSGKPTGIAVADNVSSIAVWSDEGIFWWNLLANSTTPLRFAIPNPSNNKFGGRVSKVLITSSGRIAALSAYGGTLLVWDSAAPNDPPIEFKSSNQPFQLELPLLEISATHLLVAGTDDIVRIFDITHPSNQPLLIKDVDSRFIIQSNDGRLITASQSGSIEVRDVSKLAAIPLKLQAAQAQIDAMKICSQNRLAAFVANATLSLWSLDDAKHIRTIQLGQREYSNEQVFSPNGRWLASTDSNGDVLIWDLSQDEPHLTRLKGHEKSISHLEFTPNGLLVSASLDLTVRVWDLEKPNFPVSVLRGHDRWLRGMRCLPGERLLTEGLDGTVRVWNLKRPFLAPAVILFPYHSNLEMNERGQLISLDYQSGVTIWNQQDNVQYIPNPVAAPEDEQWTTFVMAGSNQVLLAGSKGTVAIWNLNEIHSHPKKLFHHSVGLRAMAVSHDGRIAMVDDTGKVWIRHSPTSEPALQDSTSSTVVLRGSQKGVGVFSVLRFATDGRLAVGEATGDVRVWAVASGQSIPQSAARGDAYGSITDILWTVDGKLVVADQSPLVRVFDLNNKDQAPQILRGETQMGHRLKFLPDGRLAALDYLGTIRLWDLSSPGALPVKLPHFETRSLPSPQPPGRLAIGSINGHQHLVATFNSAVTMTTLDIDELLEHALQTVGRNLSRSEWRQNISDEDYRPTIPHLPITADEEDQWIGQMYN